MTHDTNKLRAIFLASLMFFWLFAGTVAFAGGAAATADDIDAENLDVTADGQIVTLQNVDTDADLQLDITELDAVIADDISDVGVDDVRGLDASNAFSGTTDADDAQDGIITFESDNALDGDDGEAQIEIGGEEGNTDLDVTGASVTEFTGEQLTYEANQPALNEDNIEDDFAIVSAANTNVDDITDAESAVSQITVTGIQDSGGDTDAGEFVAVWDLSDGIDNPELLGFDEADSSEVVVDIDSIGSDTTIAATIHPENEPDENVVYAAEMASVTFAEGELGGEVDYGFDGSVVYQGQDVFAFGEGIGDADYELRSVDSFDSGEVDDSSFEEELDVFTLGPQDTIGDFTDEYSAGALDLVLRNGYLNEEFDDDGLIGLFRAIDNTDPESDLEQQLIDAVAADLDVDPQQLELEDVPLSVIAEAISDEPTLEEMYTVITGAPPADGQVEALTAIVDVDTDDYDSNNYFVDGPGLAGDGDLQRGGTYEVTIQTLEAEFDEDDQPVISDNFEDSLVELDVDSNRGQYSTNVSIGDLATDETLFNGATLPYTVFDTDEYEDPYDAYTSAEEGQPSNLWSAEELLDALDADPEFDNVPDSDRQLDLLGYLGSEEAQDTEIGDLLDPEEEPLTGQDYVSPLITGYTTIEGDGNYDLETSGDAVGPWNIRLYDQDEVDEGDQKVLSHNVRDQANDLTFLDRDELIYVLDFEIFDTEAETDAQVEVIEEDIEIDFSEGVYTQSAGDIVHVEADLEDTDEALIQFGDEDAGFLDVLYVEDDDDSGDVEFWVNTRTIGTAAEPEQVIYSDDDVAESFIAQGTHGNFNNWEITPTFYDDDDLDADDIIGFEEYLEELDLIDDAEDDDALDQLIRPLQPTDYDLAATASTEFIAEDGESDLDEEDGFATVDLQRPDLGDTVVWTGPEENADDKDTIEELVNDSPLTETDEVAIDDLMIAQIEASGLYGMMVAIEEDFDPVIPDEEDGFDSDTLYALTEADHLEGEGISLTFEDVDPIGNQDANELDLEDASDDAIYILADNEAGEMYVVVDTDDEPFDRDLRDGAEFEVELEYETDDDDRFEFDGSETLGGADEDLDDEAYPYFDAGEGAVTSATFTFADASAEFDNVDEDDLVTIEPGEEATVSGTTNVAPGSDASVRVQQRGDTASFLETTSVDIEDDGSFEAEIDFSDREEDDEARVGFRVRGSTVVQQHGIFGEVEEPEETPDETPEDTPEETPDETPETPEDTPADTPEETEEEPEDQAGFGAVIALVALLGAALLAARRTAIEA